MMGDCVCALNPIYGQGITIATLTAKLLATELEKQTELPEARRWRGFGVKFQRKLAKLIEVPWMLAAGSDALWPETQVSGDPGLRIRFMRSLSRGAVFPRFMDGFLRVIAADPTAARRLMEVMQLKRSPNTMMSPAVLLKTFREFARPTIRSVN
jgi:flavin-dependent dehydrogenase